MTKIATRNMFVPDYSAASPPGDESSNGVARTPNIAPTRRPCDAQLR
jgi:hypothetical protein